MIAILGKFIFSLSIVTVPDSGGYALCAERLKALIEYVEGLDPNLSKKLKRKGSKPFRIAYELEADFWPVDKNGDDITSVKKTGVRKFMDQSIRVLGGSLKSYASRIHTYPIEEGEVLRRKVERLRIVVEGTSLVHLDLINFLSSRNLFAKYQFEIRFLQLQHL